MQDTKEKILATALRLFSERGWEAVSVRDIADALGLTKGALYRHFPGKRGILDAILARMEELDARQAADHAMPAVPLPDAPQAYASAAVADMVAFAKAMFRHWTQDVFASRFRRMLALEQFRNPEMRALHQQYLVSGPLGYMANLFAARGLPNPREEAARFYAPMFFLYSLADGAGDPSGATALADALLDDAGRRLDAALAAADRAVFPDGIVIRRETERDRRAVETLVRDAFWNVYRPGCLEHFVLHRFRSDPDFVPALDFVMEKDGRIVGQNVFVRAAVRRDDGSSLPVLAMGPICIAPALQRRGLGKRLLDFSLGRAAALGFGAVCFEGDIAFYGHSGFVPASRFGIRYHGLPEGADASFFLARELRPGWLSAASGEYAPPPGYFAADRDPAAFAAFDALFPRKEKKTLPGQLFR